MPLLLHLADVHLGARHADLGAAAVQQRERQLAAFVRAVDVGLAEHVDAALICGDLFDSNAQPRRTVERAASELRRLTEAGIRVVIIPGTHDAYDSHSIYRTFDLPAMAGTPPGSELLTVLTPERPDIVLRDLDMVVYGRVFATKRAPRSPLQGFDVRTDDRGGWKVGMIHGSRLIPGRVERDDVLFTDEEVAASGLDYLALGHWHSFLSGRAGATTWAYPGAPEPVAVDQDGAGDVCLVRLEDGVGGRSSVHLERVRVGRTTFRRMEVDAASLGSQDELVRRLAEQADCRPGPGRGHRRDRPGQPGGLGRGGAATAGRFLPAAARRGSLGRGADERPGPAAGHRGGTVRGRPGDAHRLRGSRRGDRGRRACPPGRCDWDVACCWTTLTA